MQGTKIDATRHRHAAAARAFPGRVRRVLAAAALAPLVAHAAQAGPVETPVDAAGPAGALQGVMLAPGAAAGPVALIIPGSGPTDRDGNSPLGVRASTYRLLAEDLAAYGDPALPLAPGVGTAIADFVARDSK